MGKNVLKLFTERFLRILFPLHCISCGIEGASFCYACRTKIPIIGSFDRDGVFSLWEYRHPNAQHTLLALKYKNQKTVAEEISESLYDTLLEQLSEISSYHEPLASAHGTHTYVVVPIPLSAQRMRKRGYNQSSLLAEALSQRNPDLFLFEPSVLRKTKDTETQVSVRDRSKRLNNIRGSFSIEHPEKIQGKIVLVIDDITTTGATLAEARRVLKKAGARAVYGIAVAH